jgi:selenoprotein W-related protein
LAEEIKQEVGVDAQLIPGGGGVFDVKMDGTLIYSKKQTGRFPEPYEVTNRIP